MERAQLVIKKLIMLSIPEKSAKQVVFHRRRNLIIGENNVGKSSIIKSIYHTMGADVHFDNIWEKADVISLLSFTFGMNHYTILRIKSHFGVFDADQELIGAFNSITKQLSPFLADLFSNKLQLKQSQTNKRIYASPAMQFLPFYIDQDKSWSNSWNAFEGLGAFSNFKKDLIEFFTGIKPNEWYLLSEKIDSISANIKELKKEAATINSAKKNCSQAFTKNHI